MKAFLTNGCVIAATAAQGDEMSLPQHLDCIKQAAFRHNILNTMRNQGDDISYSEVERAEVLMTFWSKSFGERLQPLSKTDQQHWVQEAQTMLNSQVDELIALVKRHGLTDSLAIVDQRLIECHAKFEE